MADLEIRNLHVRTEDREILAEMRRRVAQAGCDGVVDLRKGGVGTVGEGRWQGTLYVCR